jgi:hypothetical protein
MRNHKFLIALSLIYVLGTFSQLALAMISSEKDASAEFSIMDIDRMTIENYLELSVINRGCVNDLIMSALKLAKEKKFELYMIFDQFSEVAGISTDILTNAVIALTHQRKGKVYRFYQVKETNYYREYYGEENVLDIFINLENNFSKTIAILLFKAGQNHSAYPWDADFIGSLVHCSKYFLNEKITC